MKKSEIEKYIGNQAQIGGTRHYILSDGWGRNLRAIDINSGSGLQYTILPDRGMDISLASFKGNNLVYLTCNGETHPAFYESDNFGWLHTFGGGLLTTCGLTHLGPPCIDDGENLGLHGRYSTIPAKQVVDLSEWIDDEYHIIIRGVIEDAVLFGYKLRLVREIKSVRGENSIEITDTVTNFGSKPSPYSILYHFNIGYPLLSENTVLKIDTIKTDALNKEGELNIDNFKYFSKPQKKFNEQLFCHTLKSDFLGYSEALIENKKLGISFSLKYDTANLPLLMQWKMMGEGEYVLGIEPSNSILGSRKDLKEKNILAFLKPNETTTNRIKISINSI